MYRYSCVYAFRLNNICFKEVKNVEVLGQCQLEENSTDVSYNTCISLVRVRMGSKNGRGVFCSCRARKKINQGKGCLALVKT